MKKALMIFIISLTACNNQEYKKYDYILDNLKYNYVRNKSILSNMKICESYDLKNKKKDSLNYEKGLKEFYNSKVDIILYLLNFEKDTLKYNNWITYKDPCSSLIEKKHLINNSKGALILIDNYLLNINIDTIVIPKYFDKLNYTSIKKIYNPNSKIKTKEMYNQLIKRYN